MKKKMRKADTCTCSVVERMDGGGLKKKMMMRH